MHHDTERGHAPDREENLRKLRDLVKGMHVAMLTTQGEDGRLFSRPLRTQEIEFHGDLWFASGYDSGKVREIEANPQVNVAYASKDDGTYVSISGFATILRDRAEIERHASGLMGIFFPDGKDDPNLCLIRVEAQSAEFWDGPGNMVTKAAYLVTTAVTRNPANLTSNERINLQ